MIAPRLELLSQFPDTFVLERVRFKAADSGFMRLEKWNGDKAGEPARRYRLIYGHRAVIDCRIPIVINGMDPFEVLRDRVLNDIPGCIATLDLRGVFDEFM